MVAKLELQKRIAESKQYECRAKATVWQFGEDDLPRIDRPYRQRENRRVGAREARGERTPTVIFPQIYPPLLLGRAM
jgi:hypothetical protein